MKYIKLFEELTFKDKKVDQNIDNSFLIKGDISSKLFDSEDNFVGSLHYRIRDNIFYLVELDILEEYRGNKYGSYIIIEVIKRAKEANCKIIELEVVNSNKVAVNLYKKFGFQIKEEDRFYWIMNLHI